MRTNGYLWLAALALSAFAVACSDDDGAPVTITGVLADIDTAALVEGAKVYLIDAEGTLETEAPSAADGTFSLTVPSGSAGILVTDDFDSGGTSYIPLINYLAPEGIVTFDADTDVGLIHVCPAGTGGDQGTVASINNYLAAGSPALFTPATIASSAGVLGAVFVQANSGAFGLTDQISVASNTADCPVGYINGPNFYDESLVPQPELGPNIFQDGGTATDAASGTLFSVCAGGDSVEITLTDNDAGRALDFGGPYVVPVRPNSVSLLIFGSVDGVTGKSILEVFSAGGLL
ncbi:MAG TPA: hypothetical protein VI895_13820 [Bdellovibrionota bacterium]|nr:hypothetical protein [Bdellovibrionota bacterium]